MVRSVENSTVYTFEGFRLDTAKRRLYGPDGTPVSLKAKAFDTLLFLAGNAGRVIDRDELLAVLWPDTVVEENNLTQHISSLRRVFGEKPDDHRFIATVPGRGYMFVAQVRAETGKPEGNDDSPVEPKRTSRKVFIFLAALVVTSLLVIYVYKTQPSTTGSIRSIAVLPFKPIIESASNPIFEMGMTDTLIRKLAGAQGLSVPQLALVTKYSSPNQDAIQAGRELGVDAVLDGRIQVSGERVHISVSLMSVNDSTQLWSGPFEEDFTGIFSAQESIAERVAVALRKELSASAKKRYTENLEAYTRYLEGRIHLSKLAPEEVNRGIRSFEQAVQIDPNYALAYAGISDSYRSLLLSAEHAPSETARSAIVAAEKALQLDPQLAEAHTNLGVVYFWFQRDWLASEAEFKRALEIDPNLALNRIYYAHLLSNLGRDGEALTQAEEARKLDPFSAYTFTVLGLAYQRDGNLNEAIRCFDKAKELDSSFWLVHFFTAVAYTDLQRYKEAMDEAREASILNPSQSISTAYESVNLAGLGRRHEAEAILNRLLKRSAERYVPPYHIAIAYMGLGDRENALLWLEQSFSQRDSKMVFLKTDHIWDGLRSEPRFIELMKGMKFEQ